MHTLALSSPSPMLSLRISEYRSKIPMISCPSPAPRSRLPLGVWRAFCSPASAIPGWTAVSHKHADTYLPLPPASYTFQEVQEHTDQIWKFQRHDLIEEYHGRPPAPPPFILLSHLQLLIKRIVLKIPAKRHKQLSESPCPQTAVPLSWVQAGV